MYKLKVLNIKHHIKTISLEIYNVYFVKHLFYNYKRNNQCLLYAKELHFIFNFIIKFIRFS